MKLSFPSIFPVLLSFVFITLSISCKQTEPKLSFYTEYSIAADSTSIIDADHTIVNIKLTDLADYSHYTYTLSNDSGKIHSNDTLQLSKEISIDLKNTPQLKKYQNQELDVNLTLLGDGISKTIEHDVKYLFDATSPIPYVNITTKDGKMPKNDKIKVDADFAFYDVPMEDGWYSMSGEYQSGKGTIHARGQGSLGFPKLSFALNLGKDNPISIMGMPASHKWIMIGNWIDTSHLCNKVSYDTYAEMGHYGPQSQHVQVFINNKYWGLYTFGEKVQRGKEHVDTKKKSKGGFIVKEVDNDFPNFRTLTGRRFDYEYPDYEEVTDEQKADIQEKINLYEAKVKKGLDWQENVNEEAEIDYFIVTDVFANPDSYYNGKNVFYFYNRDNELEPVIWDFIWSYGTPYYVCTGNNPWCYIYSPVGYGYCKPDMPCSSWAINVPPASELMYGNAKYSDHIGYNRFLLMEDYMKNAQNVNMFKDRYNDWRTGKDGKNAVLSDTEILSRTDALIKTLRSGGIYKKDSLRWQGEDSYQYGMRFTPEQVRTKIKERLLFMDTAVKAVEVQK
ncbi:CotH kinase family protein [Kordia sp. YSTF-M3]|uniref:CotH kinase family protein n=1 Tax=Kordia aestuariivivens TaxID=2759037 RepID=A0ABR7QFC6_9FLAO|nr:CotH kinase family protein [Kordia aestuariivivens]MBC8757275.1 CotH kinase family protein [Kordia aestuariivivens]